MMKKKNELRPACGMRFLILSFVMSFMVSVSMLPQYAAAAETEAAEMDAAETDAAEMDAAETDAAEMDAAETEEAETEEAEAEDDDLAEWTVMLYLCGTDLESNLAMATSNLNGIAQTHPVPEVNVVVETGGAYEWHADDLGMNVDPSKLERWSYTDKGFRKVGESELASMGEASTLEDFLTWTQENYPAKKYQLILWDHGGASIDGVVFDQIHGFSSLQLFDIARALEDSGIYLESFMTDTCLMATLETVEAVAPYARYFIGSEESFPGNGCNYASFIQYLYDDPACNGAMYGKRICSSTERMYSDLNHLSDLGFLTMSLIDLSKVAPVRKAFDDYIMEVDQLLDKPAAFYEYCYATRNRETYVYKEYADIYDLADLASGHGVSAQTCAALQDAVEDAVIYNIRGNSHIRSHGLTEYYSFNENQFRLDHFSRVCSDPVYLAFLDRLSYKWKAPEWVYKAVEHKPDISSASYASNVSVGVSEDGKSAYLEIPSGDSSVIEGAWELLQYDSGLDLWQMYGRDPFITEQDDGTSLRWESTFDGTWPTLEGIPLSMSVLDEADSYVLFTTPMTVDGMTDSFKVLYRTDGLEEPEYELIGSSEMDDHTGFPSRNMYPVASDSLVEPLGRLLNVNSGTVMTCKKAEPFTYYDDMEITKQPLPAGEYVIRFVTTDIFGNEKTSDTIQCEWDGSSVVYEDPEDD